MPDLKGKTLLITGASRGIGKAIALRAARDGANVIVAAKTVEPHPTLPGTIHDAAREIEAHGGKALAVAVDIRDEDQVRAAVEKGIAAFGGMDILVNNASAISLTPTERTPIKRYDLMMDINVRGTFVCSQACIPWLRRGTNPHILMLSPPTPLERRWYAGHTPYTVSKHAMSLLALGMAEELRADGIAVNALWPRTIIDTVALRIAAEGLGSQARKPEIMADAAYAILTSDSRATTGNFFIDEQVLRNRGITDFSGYSVTPGVEPRTDFFVS
jgi:citronellol/citronellal dehydrogenase